MQSGFGNPQITRTAGGAWEPPRDVYSAMPVRRSRILYIDSRIRDVEAFPTANNFAVTIPVETRGVSTVRLRRIQFPIANSNNPDVTATTIAASLEPMVVLACDEIESPIEMVGSTVHETSGMSGRSLNRNTMPYGFGAVGPVESNAVVPVLTYPKSGGGPPSIVNPLVDRALATIPVQTKLTINSIDYVSYEPPIGAPVVAVFKGERERMARLAFSLWTWGSSTQTVGTRALYPIAPETAVAVTSASGLLPYRNIQLELEIVSDA